MPANVKTMFYAESGGVPWHGTGKPINHKQSVEEGLVDAGADYETEVVPQFTVDKDENGKPLFTKTKQVAIRHKESKLIFGYSGEKYRPYQNRQAFGLFQPLLDDDYIRFETGGVLGEGEICWILAKIQKPNLEIVRGDEVEMNLLLSNPHDGKKAIGFGLTPIRVVCQNTLAMAMRNSQSKIIKVKHNSNTQVNLENLRDALTEDMLSFETTAEKYRFLASKGVNQKDLMKYVKIICKAEPEESLASMSTRKANIIETILSLVESGRGQDNPQVRGTWWAAYNGVTEYLNYGKGNNVNNRLTNLWFTDEPKKAFDLAMDAAQGKNQFALSA